MKTLSGFLDKIAGLTKLRNSQAKGRVSETQLRELTRDQSRQPLSLREGLKRHHGIIAEIKRSSPSRGPIAPDLDPVAVAGEYLGAGASAISVLTEPSHFGGEIEDLRRVRAAFDHAPLLMKDFVIDPYQIWQARAYGADAVLLIVALLDLASLKSLHALAQDLGLSVLVEVHDQIEFETAIELGAKLVGVNNRDLKSLRTDLAISRLLAPLRPKDVCLVSESGIDSRAAITELRELGFDGFLIGTALMQNQTPGSSLLKLVSE